MLTFGYFSLLSDAIQIFRRTLFLGLKMRFEPLENLVYNFKIYRLLKKFAKQRVTIIDPKRRVLLIEYGVEYNKVNNDLLETCYMRGWIEPLEKSIPHGKLNIDGTLPNGPIFQNLVTVWKLTDSGWAAINRSHQLFILGLFLTIISIIISIK